MHPTLFTIGRWNIPTYTVLLDLGLILALVLIYREGRRQGGAGTAAGRGDRVSGEAALDLGLWVVIGGVLGGRIGHVLANRSLFSEDWTRAFRIWEGGLAWRGAFLGGLMILALLSWRRGSAGRQQPSGQDPVPRADSLAFLSRLLSWADLLTPALALGLAFGWAACLMGGCAYGAIGEGWGMVVLPDLAGLEAPRFPTQALGTAFCLLLFVGFWFLRGRWPFRGAAFLTFCLFHFGAQFFLEFTRGDESAYLGPWRLGQALDFALALMAAAGLLVLWWRAPEVDEARGLLEESDLAELPPSVVAGDAPLPGEDA